VTDPALALMQEHGLTPEEIDPGGGEVVRRRDVERVLRERGARPVPREGPSGDRVRRNQEAVAAVVTQSHGTVPAAHCLTDLSAQAFLDARLRRRDGGGGHLDLPEVMIKAMAVLRARFPRMYGPAGNGPAVDVGVTVDVGHGLYVPVVPDAQDLSVARIARMLAGFRVKALRGTFRQEELRHGTICLSLTPYRDVVATVPIIFPGQVCMISLGGLRERLVLDGRGQVVPRREVPFGLSYDHRVVNGRDAVLYQRAIERIVESCERLEELLQ